MSKWIRNNSLSIVFLLLFAISLTGQFITGWKEHNKNLAEHHMMHIAMTQYVRSGHFLESTFENWESEFLQMVLFVVLTISLRQKGSSEAKEEGKKDSVDREPSPKRKGAPWPVIKGGWILTVYKYSLTIALFILFAFSFGMHLYGSLKDENEQLALKGLPQETLGYFLGDSRFWFESFQNWQSEFLSVFVVVVLSIYLRQKGSPQSKPVDVPDSETGK